jgi:hypothetical protein
VTPEDLDGGAAEPPGEIAGQLGARDASDAVRPEESCHEEVTLPEGVGRVLVRIRSDPACHHGSTVRRIRTTAVRAIALASLCLSVVSCVASGGSSSAEPATGTSTLLTWAPPFATGGHVTAETAVMQAREFDVIAAHPWTYRGDVARMRRARSSLTLLAYLNGTFAQAVQAHAYPSSWYLRDAAGHKVRSLQWGNYLMDPTNPGWIADRVARCRRSVRTSGDDGCMVDMLGTAPLYDWYVTGAPIDPTTGERWTVAAWLAATTRLAAEIRAGSGGAIVIGNGLGDGRRYFDTNAPSQQLLNGIDGAIADGWLRTADRPVDRYPSVSAWTRDVEMLSSTDKSVFVETKVWTAASPEQVAAWHRFSLASFLLGNDGHAYFAFSDDPHGAAPSDRLAASVRIGDPLGAFRDVHGVFQRSFSNGIVVVNPSADPASTDLGGNYRDEAGAVVRSVTLDAHSAVILTSP